MSVTHLSANFDVFYRDLQLFIAIRKQQIFGEAVDITNQKFQNNQIVAIFSHINIEQ